MTILYVKVKPGAKKNRLVGFLGEILKMEIKSPPVDGKANDELICFLSHKIGVTIGSIRIKAGWNSRQKILVINSDLTKEKIIEKISGKQI